MKKERYVVQHEFDDEPTYIVDKINDPDGDNVIEFPPKLIPDAFKRRKIAEITACILNSWENSF